MSQPEPLGDKSSLLLTLRYFFHLLSTSASFKYNRPDVITIQTVDKSRREVERLTRFGNTEDITRGIRQLEKRRLRLTMERHTKSQFLANAKTVDDGCPICINGVEVGTRMKMLRCGHTFCHVCIQRWLHVNATCPVCRRTCIDYY